MGARLITLDTSGLFAIANRRDPGHGAARTVLAGDRGPYLVPAGILGETGYLLERRLGTDAIDAVLADLESGALTFDCGEEDFPRVRELLRRYDDLPLGLADASVVACAERNGGAVLTLDVRHFGVVAGERTIRVLP